MYPLHRACLEKNYDEAERILKSENVNVNETDENGVTALFLSIKKDDTKMMQMLVKHGATKFWK
jgi:ankyrin repeat protein